MNLYDYECGPRIGPPNPMWRLVRLLALALLGLIVWKLCYGDVWPPANPAPFRLSCRLTADRMLVLRLEGGDDEAFYDIESSTNMVNWQPVRVVLRNQATSVGAPAVPTFFRATFISQTK